MSEQSLTVLQMELLFLHYFDFLNSRLIYFTNITSINRFSAGDLFSPEERDSGTRVTRETVKTVPNKIQIEGGLTRNNLFCWSFGRSQSLRLQPKEKYKVLQINSNFQHPGHEVNSILKTGTL